MLLSLALTISRIIIRKIRHTSPAFQNHMKRPTYLDIWFLHIFGQHFQIHQHCLDTWILATPVCAYRPLNQDCLNPWAFLFEQRHPSPIPHRPLHQQYPDPDMVHPSNASLYLSLITSILF